MSYRYSSLRGHGLVLRFRFWLRWHFICRAYWFTPADRPGYRRWNTCRKWRWHPGSHES